jgi:hypothetical protein
MIVGPPRSIDDETIEALFGDWSEIQFLIKQQLPIDHSVRKYPGMGEDCASRAFLLTPKKS